MSTSPLHKFVLYAPDAPDALQRRLSVRPEHIEGMGKLSLQGSVVIGGGTITPESVASVDKKLTGSVVIYAAESLEAVRKIVESDIYYTTGVWDKEKLVIAPFLQAALPTK